MTVDMKIGPGIEFPESELIQLCRRYQIRELSLFGSAARNELTSGSDIDLLVDFLPEASISLLGHVAAERELSQLLGRKVDLVSKRALRTSMRNDVIAQARLVYAA